MAKVIYKIINLENGKFYVGSSIDQVARFRLHKKRLNRGNHHSKHLQAAWNKYGADKFIFKVVEIVPEDQDLQVAENRWLEKHVGKEYCYNHSRYSDTPMRGIKSEDHPNYGKVWTEEEKQKVSSGLKRFYAKNPAPRLGQVHTEETKVKISEARKGKYAGTEHYRYGQTLSDEIRKKIGDAQRGIAKGPRVLTDEGRAKIKAAAAAGHYASFKGKRHTLEARGKLSKLVFVTPDGIMFPSLTVVLEFYGLQMTTLRRALKSGKPLSKGRLKGYTFSYGGIRHEHSITEQDQRLIRNKLGNKFDDILGISVLQTGLADDAQIVERLSPCMG